MRTVIILLALAALSALSFSCATGQQATSEIPERREFPVSEGVSPCQDFFSYACDGAIRGFQLREDRSRHIFAFNDSHERVLEKKKEYLKDLQSESNPNVRSKQLKAYYASCVDQSARKDEELAFVQTTLAEVNKLDSKKALAQYWVDKSLAGQDSHLSFGNIANLNNSDKYDFIIMPARMTTMPERSYYQNPQLMADFKALVTDFFTLTGSPNPAERAEKIAQFETEFINFYPTPAERRKIWTEDKYSTKAKLKSMAPLFAMDALLAKIPEKVKIRNPMDRTFIKANSILGKYSLDDLKTVYLYQSLSSIMDEGYPEFFNKKFAFENKHLGGPPQRPELTERCTEDVMSKFTKEIDAELFANFFPNFPEARFVSLLESVRSSIIEGLEKNSWLTQKAKANAITKMKAAEFQVVKPKTDREWDFNPVAEYQKNAYLGNNLTLAKNLSAREFTRLPEPIDKSVWYMGPLTVNAYYDPTKNKFVMPAGILQYPFYDPALPDWVNLGAVGAVVGHELGHGVDDQGAKYDERGKVRQWMTNQDIVTFKKRGEALISQFKSAGHDGELTLGENIGDLVGLTFAYEAAKKKMPMTEPQRTVATQQFYLQWARAWCGVMRPKMRERLLKTDPHSLIDARVNEQVKHQPDFAKAYSCKAGDKLVLPEEEIVRIW